MSRLQYNLSIAPVTSVKVIESSTPVLKVTSPHKMLKICSQTESRIIEGEFHTVQQLQSPTNGKRLSNLSNIEPHSAGNFFKRAGQSRFSDISVTTGLDSRLVVPKYTEKEQVVRLYLSKVISNRSYNIAKCFRKWKTGECEPSPQKKHVKGNMWFQRAALKIAKCSHITTQKSLWRLMIDPEPKAVARAQIRTINMTVIPQQIVNFYKERDLLLEVDGLIWQYQLRQIIDRFRRNAQNRQIVRRYLNRLVSNQSSNGLFALRKLAEWSHLHATSKKEQARNILAHFLKRKLDNHSRILLQQLKQNVGNARQKRFIALARICQSTHLQLQSALSKLHQHMLTKKYNVRMQKFTKVADRLNLVVAKSVQPLFTKPKYNRQVLASRLEKLNKVYSKFRTVNLNRCFAKWRGCKNTWFVRAAKRLALNSQIDLQRSLWRLYEHAGLKRQTSGMYGLMPE